MQHQSLRVALHGRGYGNDRLPIAHGLQNPIRGTHGELRFTHGDLLLRVDVRPAGTNGYIQAFVFVVATNLGIVEAAVLRLRIPVRLQRYRRQPVGALLPPAASSHGANAKQAHADRYGC